MEKIDQILKTLKKILDNHIMPFTGKIIMTVLALKGTSDYLPSLSDSQRTTSAFIVIALLSYIAYRRK